MGVTVNPVRVKSIQDFGGLDVVADRLMDAEKKKVGDEAWVRCWVGWCAQGHA